MNVISPKDRPVHRTLALPTPAAGILAYRRERLLALVRSPRRLWNYVLYKTRARTADLKYRPIKADVENVSRCNFRCTMCQVSDWENGKRAKDMSIEDFRKLIDEEYGLVEIKLQGMGEPLMQGDDYFAMIRYARAKNIWVRTVSNGSILHLNANYKKLIDSGVNEVQISIDGATAETFEKIRRGGDFARVTDNCRLLNAYCRETNRIRTKMWTVVQRDNFDQLEDLVELGAELGFPQQVFSLDLVDWGDSRWQMRNGAVAVGARFNTALADKLISRGEALGIDVRFWYAGEKYKRNKPGRGCPWPFERSFVGSDGRISPCCLIANPDNFELNGAKGLGAVWNGESYRQFRKAHLDGNPPDICHNCFSDSPSEPDHRLNS